MSTKRRTTAEKIAEVQARKAKLQEYSKRLLQMQKTEERRERNKRVKRRGEYIENLIDGAGAMTDDKFYRLIENALKRANIHPPAPKSEKPPAPSVSESEGVVDLE